MNAQEKAKQIFEGHLSIQKCDENESAINASIFTVNSIIDALKITIGYLDLSYNENFEVSKDFEFWKDVRKSLQS